LNFFFSCQFSDREDPLDVGLPNEWVWDIIDEFMYQFTQFSTYRARADKLKGGELGMLRDPENVMVIFLF
jgi:translation initiation factor 3 subunit L